MRASGEDEFVKTLTAATDQFIVERGGQKTVIAGYHWFSDWGRDTMIALPGLTLPTNRYDVARSILRTFAQHVDRGMLPNRFPDAGETPEYNTVDATLWFFEAVRAYLAYTGDLDFVRNDLYNVLTDIVSWHVRGTRFGIKVDPSGLLSSGERGVQLTWMDAKVGDWVVTRRAVASLSKFKHCGTTRSALWRISHSTSMMNLPASVMAVWPHSQNGASIVCCGTKRVTIFTTS